MLTTAAGTITPARVLVIGAGVAGLQAIATARRLGAVVSAYDLRPAVKEQVQSLGGTFRRAAHWKRRTRRMPAATPRRRMRAFYQRQRELLGKVVAESDVVITTAVIPGKKSPVLVTEEMVAGMAPGSVIVDLAAERGGNCELTRPGRDISVRRRHHHRHHQSRQHRSLSRQPDVREESAQLPGTPGEGWQAADSTLMTKSLREHAGHARTARSSIARIREFFRTSGAGNQSAGSEGDRASVQLT